MLICLLLGPKKAKNIDTQTRLLVDELKQLGSRTRSLYYSTNSFTGKHFQLRAWVINISRDGPALVEVIGMANPGNTIRPCYYYTIRATRAPNGIYYIPHSVKELRGNLNYRHNLRAIIEDLYSIQAIGKKKEMATLSSIRKQSIFNELPLIHIPRRYVIDNSLESSFSLYLID